MGSLVSRAQLDAVREGLEALQGAGRACCTTAASRRWSTPTRPSPPASARCCSGARDADAADRVHDIEVFGPVATLLPYRDLDHAIALAHRGQGSLVTSLYGADDAALGQAAVQLAASHGRVHVDHARSRAGADRPRQRDADVAARRPRPRRRRRGTRRPARAGLLSPPQRRAGQPRRAGAARASDSPSRTTDTERRDPEETHDDACPTPSTSPSTCSRSIAGARQKTAYVDDRGALGYGQLEDRARRLAAALLASGVRREERVLLLMLDGSDWPVSFLGASMPAWCRWPSTRCSRPTTTPTCSTHSGATAALVSRRAAAGAAGGDGARRRTRSAQLFVSQPDGAAARRRAELRRRHRARTRRCAAPAATTPQDHAFWLYSSGSTGKPKGTVHTHANPWWTAELYGKPVLGADARTTSASPPPSCTSPTASATR